MDPVKRTTTKTPNIILKKKWRPARDNTIIVEESLSENEGLRQLLQQEDMRGEEPQQFRRHVRRLTNSSRNMLHQKFKAFRKKLNEEKGLDKNRSLNSSYSDISYTESFRSSFTDITSFLLVKKHKIDRSISDGSGMAAVLVSSVMHGPSLDLISEGYDSVKSTPNQSIKSNKSKKSESLGNLSKAGMDHLSISKLCQNAMYISDESISTVPISSSTTEEEAFSDDDEEEEETTTPKDILVDADTISMVVKSVLAQENKDSDNWIEPGSTQDDEVLGRQTELRQLSNIRNDNEGKINIPTGATKIVKQGKNFKITESRIVESEASQANLESIFLPAVIDPDSENWIEPGSTTDEPETVDKERRGSLLQDLKDNISERLHQLQEHIYLPNFTDDKTKSEMNVLKTSKSFEANGETFDKHTNNNNDFKRESLGTLSKMISSFYGKTRSFEKELGAPGPVVAKMIKTTENICDTKDMTLKEDIHRETKDINNQFNIPEIYLTNMQHQTKSLTCDEYIYSSEPELGQSNDLHSPTTLGMPFMSLTKQNVSQSSLSRSEPTNFPIPPDPNTLESVLSPFKNVQLPSVKSINIIESIDNARSNVLSSSYTNLSTNKAPTLAPFPYLKHSRSELATNSISPGGGKVGHIRAESVGCKISQSPAKVDTSAPVCSLTNKEKEKDSGICRRSSDSDLNVTPKGNSICVASDRLLTATSMMRANLKAPNQENLDMMEYPFLTMTKYPPGFILHIGATVTARSVKLLERVPNPDEPETRDSWWTEIRMEIRSHARSLGCNVVLGYSEVTTISDDVCVLSATGTAAIINMSYKGEAFQIELTSSFKKDIMVSSLDEKECLNDGKANTKEFSESAGIKEISSSFGGAGKGVFPNSLPFNLGCSICHIPYTKSSVPFNVKMKKCGLCKRGKVPDVLLATVEIPECLQISGRGCFLQAQVVRTKKDLRSESNAKEISDGLPFLEYELHRLLINKLKAKGMNAIFGVKAQVVIGEKMMALIATGTAVFLTALPPPTVPKIVAGNSWTDTARLNELQKSLQETFEHNREIYQLKPLETDPQNGKQSDTDDSEDEIGELDLTTGNKDTCVLEIDDIEDLEIISLLMEPCPPEGFHVVNTQTVPGLEDIEVIKNLQMFTQVWRAKIAVGQTLGQFPNHFQRLLQTIYFKLRSMIPCAICDLRFRLDLPESDEIQLLVTGMALGIGEPSKLSKFRRKQFLNNLSDNNIDASQSEMNGKKSQDEELIFSLDEDQNIELVQNSTPTNTNYGAHSFRARKTSPQRSKFSSVKLTRHTPLRDRYGVDITPLSYVPGGKIEKYLGNLNFFFIRESTSIRENGGISGFVHSFITELLAVVRAHISALGGNAMVSFYMTELILVDNQHKNQGQCLISIGGDVVYVSYYTDD